MGKQAKLKAERREAKFRKKFYELVVAEKQKQIMQKHLVSPPDLGVAVKEEINMEDKFGG